MKRKELRWLWAVAALAILVGVGAAPGMAAPGTAAPGTAAPGIAASPGSAAGSPASQPGVKVDLSTPQAAAEAFYRGLNTQDGALLLAATDTRNELTALVFKAKAADMDVERQLLPVNEAHLLAQWSRDTGGAAIPLPPVAALREMLVSAFAEGVKNGKVTVSGEKATVIPKLDAEAAPADAEKVYMLALVRVQGEWRVSPEQSGSNAQMGVNAADARAKARRMQCETQAKESVVNDVAAGKIKDLEAAYAEVKSRVATALAKFDAGQAAGGAATQAGDAKQPAAGQAGAGAGGAALTRADAAKIVAAKNDLAVLGVTLAMFEVDNGRFPSGAEGLGALKAAPAGLPTWRGPYLKTPDTMDPWGNPYRYKSPGQHNTDYDLWSAGPDGKDGTADDIVNWR